MSDRSRGEVGVQDRARIEFSAFAPSNELWKLINDLFKPPSRCPKGGRLAA